MPIQNKLLESARSLLLSYLLTILLLLVLSLVVYRFNLSSAIVNAVIICIYILTCFLGGLRLGKKVGERRFLWGLILGTAYIALLVLISVIVNHGIDVTSTTNITALLLCLCAGMLGGMVS
jgi:putative membrane protein (TIGR04086 family)